MTHGLNVHLCRDDVHLRLDTSLCRKHHKYGVRKEHYPQLLVILTSTVESTLDKEWSEEQQMAWSNVLSFLASVVEEAYTEGAHPSCL